MYQHSSTHEHEKYVGDDFQGHNIHIHRQAHYVPSPYHNNVSTRAPSRNVAAPWNTGLCHCFDDPANCFVTCCCPCITFGHIAEIVNQGSSSCGFGWRGSLYTRAIMYGLLLLTGLPCLYSCFYRSKLRGQYDLEEIPCVDCLVHCCCEPCALCQEYRQLENLGFDMGIGWEANVGRQNRGVGSTGAPAIVQSMSR